jgi:GT2 family glycosyltransferase
MSHIEVSVSIVSYNSKKVLNKCINSVIETSKDHDIEIIVVDNCSVDGSAEMVRSSFPDIRLVQNKENVGFGKAHNQSFRLSKGKYFLILNPDTVIFPDAINRMVAFMDHHHDAGVAGCKIFWDDEKIFMFPDLKIHTIKTGIIQFTPFCRYFPNSMISQRYWQSARHLWDAQTPINVEGVTGGMMFVRRESFESVGMFDEGFFLFFEEHDLLRRIKKQGWKIYYIPDAEIQHYFEESFRNSSIDIGAVFMESAQYYYRKHYGFLGALFLKVLSMCNKAMLFLESKTIKNKKRYAEVSPVNGRLEVIWPQVRGAQRYCVELSYSPEFSDRAGMYVNRERIFMKSDILDRLPNKTGFLRVIPVYDDSSMGKVLRVFRIKD